MVGLHVAGKEVFSERLVRIYEDLKSILSIDDLKAHT